MKILYIAGERCDAQLAATALHGIAPNVTVLWASHFDQADHWIHENRDLAALVVEAQVNSQSCISFLKEVRGLGLGAAVVVIEPPETPSGIESLEIGPYDRVAKNDSLFRELPVAVIRAIERAQAMGAGPWDHQHLETVSASPIIERVDRPREAVTEVAEQRTQYEARLAAAVAARDALTQTLAESQAALDRAERARDSDAATVDRLVLCQVDFEARLADAVGIRSTLEHRLGHLEASFHQREQSWAAEQSAAVERQAKLEDVVHQERATRANLEQKLADAKAVLHDAEQRHISAITTTAAQLAERQAQYDVATARAAATWEMVDEQLREAAIEVERARQHQASSAADVERLSRRETELSFQLVEVNATHDTLENRLAVAATAFEAANERAVRERLATTKRETELQAEVEREAQNRHSVEEQLALAQTAGDDAKERHRSAMTTAAALFAERQTQFEAALTEAATARDNIGNQARDLEAALGRAQADRESNAAAAARRETELTSMLTEATTIRNTLQHRLAGTATAFKDADERATRDRLAAAKRAAQREAELDGLIHQERATRASVEQKLAQVEGALSHELQRHAAALTTVATELAERQARFEVELSQTAAAREDLRRRLIEAEVAVEGARHEHASAAGEVERLTQRETGLAGELAEAAATRNALEMQLTDAAAATGNADQRATRERMEANDRQLNVEAQLAQEIKKREELECELDVTRTAAREAERWFREETATMTTRASEHAERLEDQIARERLDQESRLAKMREGHERDRLIAEAEVGRLAAERTETQHNLEEVGRRAQQTLDRVSSEHARALATLVATVAERDTEIEERAGRHSTSLQSAQSERTQLQDGFRTMLAARNREIEDLRSKLRATIQELDDTKSRRDVLHTEAERVPQFEKHLEESRAEIRRQFEQCPLALCRCTPDGALTDANRALAVLVGSRQDDELLGADFAATVFESPDDLSWLIERCLSTRARESIETAWRGRNGSRLVVRLSAFSSAPDVIEIVAEDLTNLRALEDRLGQAYRMEAVGRLASEVAVTCGSLLRDVHQDAQQWLMTVSGDTALQDRGERLLEDVTRAASFLRQLAAYGEEQAGALAPVDVNSVLRDLEPVLKRVAGDDVELELPKTASSLNVDVKAERVERLLVNLASYGRERMPFGGRLKIELASVVVDRKFIDEYPNVRQGPHALITVTEVRRAMPAQGPLRPGDGQPEPNAERVAAEKPGVDLGALQGLIHECSGHLWMAVEPPGDMVVKIHLPLRAADDRAVPRTSAVRTSRGHTMSH